MTTPNAYSKDIKGFIYHNFVICPLPPRPKDGIVKHELFAEVTDQTRLDAHVIGFTQNIEELTK